MMVTKVSLLPIQSRHYVGCTEVQIELFLQPKVKLSNGRLIGAEALEHWVHPEQGVSGHYVFNPAA